MYRLWCAQCQAPVGDESALAMVERHAPTRIVSGGQTGVDRAALDVAIELGISCGGWCPRGRRAEDGPIAEHYPLRETQSERYEVRTEKNVLDSDATLVLSRGQPSAGTALTVRLARRHGKPCMVIDMGVPLESRVVKKWITVNRVRVLNVAGPRARGSIHADARRLLLSILRADPDGRPVTP